MQERRNDEFERIQQSLAKDRRQQERKEGQIEEVSTQLEKIAGEAVAKYHSVVEAESPEAEATINQTIQPWFTNLISSGTYKDLLKWSKSNERGIRFSDPILYYWPRHALGEIAKGSSDRYRDKAEFILDYCKRQNIQQAVRTYADSDEVWYAGFELKKSGWGKSDEVKIWRQPTVGNGFGFAMISSSYQISVDPENVASVFDQISPEVWTAFGRQIESGQVWKIIEQSIKPRKVKAATLGESLSYAADDRRAAREYLQNRRWPR